MKYVNSKGWKKIQLNLPGSKIMKKEIKDNGCDVGHIV